MGLLKSVASISGILAVLICVGSVLLRLTGNYHLVGLEALTLFNSGVGLMVFSCLLKLEMLTRTAEG